jgi:ABC-type Zn uptake system ZnuABC Zn-binding protein ZnuA
MLHRPRILGKSFWFLLICIGGLLYAAPGGGCDRQAASNAAPPERFHVFTSVYALADVVRQIGGERVDVEWIVESGQPLQNIEVTPERRNKFRNADFVVTRGSVEPWMLEGTGDAYRDRRLIRIDGLISSRDADPSLYLWLDPQVAIELADQVAQRLSTLEPRSEIYFRGNADQFKKQVAELIESTARQLAGWSETPFVSLDRGFVPLARRFNLTEVKPPSALSLRDPSPYAVRVLRDTARSNGAGAIFANAETPPALIRDWEARLGMPVLPLDALGSSSASGRSHYLDLVRYNLEQLVSGVLKSKKPATKPTSQRYRDVSEDEPPEVPEIGRTSPPERGPRSE